MNLIDVFKNIKGSELSLAIAFISLSLTGANYLWARRKFLEERLEKVSVKVRRSDHYTLQPLELRLVNSGRFPLFIESVTLRYYDKNKKSIFTLEFWRDSEKVPPIEPGDDCDYDLPHIDDKILDEIDITAVNPRDFSISICSKEKEICVIESDLFFEIFKEYFLKIKKQFKRKSVKELQK